MILLLVGQSNLFYPFYLRVLPMILMLKFKLTLFIETLKKCLTVLTTDFYFINRASKPRAILLIPAFEISCLLILGSLDCKPSVHSLLHHL